jgi:hypothetical protein
MPHITAERLAALADEPATPRETDHLAECPACCGEREAYGRLRALASNESTRIAPAISDWSAIAAGLRAEGVLPPEHTDTFPVPTTVRIDRRIARRPWMRAAAAVLLLTGGVVGGRLSAGATPLPIGEPQAVAASEVVVLPDGDTLPTFRTPAEAATYLATAERRYQYAAAFLGQLDTASVPLEDSTLAYQARLAAIDNMLGAARQALYEVPHDPVINRYYLATLGARAATIRQINTAAPPGTRVSGY